MDIANALEDVELNLLADYYNEKLKENPSDIEVIDRLKTLMVKYDLDIKPNWDGEFYMSWIYRIGYKNDTETCPKCGSKLIPIIYGFPNEILMEQYKAGEVELGGCVISSDDDNMHCPNCKSSFRLESLNADATGTLYLYIYSIFYDVIRIVSDEGECCLTKKIRQEIGYLDDNEYEALIRQLKSMGYLYEPLEGYVKLVNSRETYD